MWPFDKRVNINNVVKECRNTPGAFLLDVREVDEYKSGHIPGAFNVPLSVLSEVRITIPRRNSVYVYCLRGARSRKAVKLMKQMGYMNVRSIGGIKQYKGKIVR